MVKPHDSEYASTLTNDGHYVLRRKELRPGSAEARATAERFCTVPPNAESSVSLEETIFWAGMSTGSAICRNLERRFLDCTAGATILEHAAICADSTKTAIIDLTLSQLEAAETDSRNCS